MKCFLLATLCLLVSAPAFAQTSDSDPATKDDIDRYFRVMHSHDMMQKMLAGMAKPMHQLAHEQCAKDKDKLPADCEARLNKMMDDMFNQMPFDEMMQAMVPAYQKHFTKGDIDALVAFYSGPTGQKLLNELPAIMAESMEAAMPIMRKQMDRMNARVQEEIAEMQKNSPPNSGTASAKN
jgi:uncharacterized protein